MSELPERLRGDGPCQDCGTADNIVWFTDNVLWNEVMAAVPGSGILCIPCFVKRVAWVGLAPTGWRLLPEWRWTETGPGPQDRRHRKQSHVYLPRPATR